MAFPTGPDGRPQLPDFITTKELAEIMSEKHRKPWTARRARYWLRSKGALVELGFGIGGRFGTTVAALTRAFPEVVEEIRRSYNW